MINPNKNLVVVLGMHRSGTSAITRALCTLGIELGDTLMPAVEGNNAKGFWEDVDINNFNEELLANLGSSWHQIHTLTTEELSTLKQKQYFLHAVELLRKKTMQHNVFGLKDPRISKLMPFWQQVFEHCQLTTHYILALRHPLSVVKSLAARDRLAPEKSYFLWLVHMVSSLTQLVNKPCLIIDYDKLISSPDQQIERIATYLAAKINKQELNVFKQEFLDSSLQHSVYQAADLALDPQAPPLVSEVYSILLQLSEETHFSLKGCEDKIKHWHTELKRVNLLCNFTDKIDAELTSTRKNLHQHEIELRSVTERATQQETHIYELSNTIPLLNSSIDELRNITNTQHKELEHLHKELKLLHKDLTQLHSKLATTKAEADALILEKSTLLATAEIKSTEQIKLIDILETISLQRFQHIQELTQTINAIKLSSSWKVTVPLRWAGYQTKRALRIVRLAPQAVRLSRGLLPLLGKILRIFRQGGIPGLKRGLLITQTANTRNTIAIENTEIDRNDYREWVKCYDTMTDEIRASLINYLPKLSNGPLISVVMPTYNPNPDWLIEAIESVRQQLYTNWQLCIADDVSTDPRIFPILQDYANKDSRIKVVRRKKNGHISAASNSALALVTGEWVALLDHDDILPEHALFWIVDTILQNPTAQLIYSDEDKIDEQGHRFEPYFKSDWNLELFYSQNMFSHLGVYRTDLLQKINGFRVGLEGSQDYDLVLRCLEHVDQKNIHHIPRVLYHWRVHAESTAKSADAKPYAAIAGERALNEHYRNIDAKAKANFIGFGYRTVYELPTIQPLVSLIIPTRNGYSLLQQCISSILDKTTYKNYEIIIIDNGSDDPEILGYFEQLNAHDNIRVIRDDRPFNYSALNNAAVKLCEGEIVGLINNDIEVIEPDWLSEMVGHCLRTNVGAVGAKLLYPDNRVQHAGVLLGLGECAIGVAGHAHCKFQDNAYGYFGRAALTQSFSAVTAACLVIKKSIYEQVNGLNEVDLKVAFNDVDFCLRVKEAGYRNVWTPFAKLYHHESATRGHEDTPEKIARFTQEVTYMQRRWGTLLQNDPAYTPNLTIRLDDFSLAWPPRIAPTPSQVANN